MAVNNLRSWFTRGEDAGALLPVLQAYMGHSSIGDTAYYLRLTAGSYPQIAALVLLFIFALQCLWFMSHVPINQMESSYIEDGLLHVDRLLNAGTEFRSPLIPVLAGFPAWVRFKFAVTLLLPGV